MAGKKVPLRQCLGCRELKNKKEMLRIVKSKEEEIFLDSTGKKNGRGAYICMSEQCLLKVIKNKGLERAFQVKIPDEVYEQLKKEWENLNAK